MKKSEDVERLYQNYIRYQSGDKSALDEVFMEVGKKVGETKRIVELEEEYKLSHTENVLDAGLVENEIEYKRNSRKLKVVFSFPCLKDMVRRAKYDFSKKGIFTGYENGKKIDSHGYKKFHSGKYDTLELEEAMQEIVIKLFQGKLSGSSIDIIDGVTLLRNIKYYLTIEMGNYNKVLCKNVPETYIDMKKGEEMSYFDQYSKKSWLESEGQISRILPYSACLEWLQRNDVCMLFKANACDIKAIIETIMNCKDTFIVNKDDDMELGLGMRPVTQETLQEMISYRHNLNVDQENISADMELIEQRLLDHLFYSLNYKIVKAKESMGIYKKESRRCLYELNEKSYIKMFDRASYIIYIRSIIFVNSNFSVKDFNNYFDTIIKYREMILGVISKEKGVQKYDMINLMSDNDYDLVDDKRLALLNIANTMILFYQKEEVEYRREHFGGYKMKSLKNWDNGFWEAKLEEEIINIRLWSSKDVKFPIHYKVSRKNVIVYCGYMNFYFCDKEGMVCYKVPKGRRIIGRYNKSHEFFIYNIE